MSELRELAGWPGGPLHVALGVFDGVHVGHRALIAHLVQGARRSPGGRAIAATFDPPPAVALGHERPGASLSTIAERVPLLREAGCDHVAVCTFDAEFAAQSAERFVDRLCAAGQIARVVVGPDFQYGSGRDGNVETLRSAGVTRGFAVEVVEPVRLEGAIVSSTRIREALRAGELALAERLLARRYSVGGTVAKGEQRGRRLGFPTLNVMTPPEKLLPKDGIYACWVTAGGSHYASATSLGTRPTFGPGPRTLESHLLDFEGDLYGSTVEVSFVQRLRDELRFDDARTLVAQIALDVEQTRTLLGR